ncbi:neurogenic differentiation factor 4-like [Cherax quadricarinatus]|uniref:neurogenic differentiation factor 4-like n=1 Tax=Cherax quadricarinatus TaxID=27406 RepID=UPI00387E41A3
MIDNTTQTMNISESFRQELGSTTGNTGEMYSIQLRQEPDSKTVKIRQTYALRPKTIIKRLQQERARKEDPKRPVRLKHKKEPLSKYRRKTANARERHRMKQINNAFESLRKILPDAMSVHTASSSMTKITTLRLAVSYIRALSDALQVDGSNVCCLQDDDLSDICCPESSLQCSLHDSLQESLQHTFQLPLQKTVIPEDSVMAFKYQDHMTSFTQICSAHQIPQLLDYCSTSSSASSLSLKARESPSNFSDLTDLLSDDSRSLEDSVHVFPYISTLSDPFDSLL